VVLNVYTIQKSLCPVDTYENYLSAAIRCQDHLANVAKDGSLAARYVLILRDLKWQVLKQSERMQRESNIEAVELDVNSQQAAETF
jgi:hypothetical protein